MINNLSVNHDYLSQANSGGNPYINITQPSAGIVRYNPAYNRLEVYDGNMWVQLAADTFVDVSPNTKAVIDWAGKKMDEERRWKEMAEKNPAIKDAYEKFKHAEEQLKIVEALFKDE